MLRGDLGAEAESVESALGRSSRILPLVTTAHCPSAANFNYWPEIYTNMSIVDPSRPGPYTDTPKPKVFGNVSPLDPQLFASINEFADSLLRGRPVGKVSPLEVAQQLEDWARGAMNDLENGGARASLSASPLVAGFRWMPVCCAVWVGSSPVNFVAGLYGFPVTASRPGRSRSMLPIGAAALGRFDRTSRWGLRFGHQIRSRAAIAGALGRPAGRDRRRYRGHGSSNAGQSRCGDIAEEIERYCHARARSAGVFLSCG